MTLIMTTSDCRVGARRAGDARAPLGPLAFLGAALATLAVACTPAPAAPDAQSPAQDVVITPGDDIQDPGRPDVVVAPDAGPDVRQPDVVAGHGSGALPAAPHTTGSLPAAT